MPAKTEKQRRFMGAELQRKREGKKTKTGMSEKELEKMASKKKDWSGLPLGRQAEIKGRALALAALEPDPAAVALHDLAAQV